MACSYQRSQLGRRIATILNPVVTHAPNSRARVASTTVLVVALLVPLAGLRTVYQVVAPPMPQERPVQTAPAAEERSEPEQAVSTTQALALYTPLSPEDIRQLALVDIRRSLTHLTRANLPGANVKSRPQTPPSSTPAAPEPAGKAGPQAAAKTESKKAIADVETMPAASAPEVLTPTAEELQAIAAAMEAAANAELDPTQALPQSPFQRLLALRSETQPTENTRVSLEQLSRERLVMPVYPRRARSQGIEGEVLVRYNIDRNGQVYNPQVIDADPRGVFDDNVLRAVRRFIFDPHEVDGRPVAVEGVEEKFVFVLES